MGNTSGIDTSVSLGIYYLQDIHNSHDRRFGLELAVSAQLGRIDHDIDWGASYAIMVGTGSPYSGSGKSSPTFGIAPGFYLRYGEDRFSFRLQANVGLESIPDYFKTDHSVDLFIRGMGMSGVDVTKNWSVQVAGGLTVDKNNQGQFRSNLALQLIPVSLKF